MVEATALTASSAVSRTVWIKADGTSGCSGRCSSYNAWCAFALLYVCAASAQSACRLNTSAHSARSGKKRSDGRSTGIDTVRCMFM